MKKHNTPYLIPAIFGFLLAFCAGQPVITLDADETPNLVEWAENARNLMEEWQPRLSNLMPSKFGMPDTIALIMKKTDEGIAYTDGNTIVVSSHWIEKHPDDIGLIVHELVHVLQAYPNFEPGWVTEGIADYLRWAIYESKPLDWFPLTEDENGYTSGYRITGGFLLWLDQTRIPGINTYLNRAMQNTSYSDEIFKKQSGYTVQQLWEHYLEVRNSAKPEQD